MVQESNQDKVYEYLKQYFEASFSKQIINKFLISAEKIANGKDLDSHDIETLLAIDECFMRDQGIHFFTEKGLKMIAGN